MGKVYFLTGATGDLGSEILVELLGQDTENTVYCLLRPKEGQNVKDRLNDLLRSMDILSQNDSRVFAVHGDLCEDLLGMDSEMYEYLAHNIDVIIHSAADVRFNQEIENIRKYNVDAVQRMLDFSKRCNHADGKLELFVYISTAFVAGRREGMILEGDLTDQYGFNNSYEQTKYEAELLVKNYMSTETPSVIFRPSVIMGASADGSFKKSSLIYPLISLLKDLLPSMIIPYSKNVELDVVPIDFVVNSILYIIQDKQNYNKYFHLAAGPGKMIDIDGELVQGIIEILDLKNVRALPDFIWDRLLPFWKRFNKPLYRKCKKLLKMSELSGYDKYGEKNRKLMFSVENTKNALLHSGINMPEPKHFLRACIEYAKYNYFA